MGVMGVYGYLWVSMSACGFLGVFWLWVLGMDGIYRFLTVFIDSTHFVCVRYGSPPFLHKPILHTLGPTQPIQHTIVSSRAHYSTSVVLHEAVMYDTGNRSNTRRFCTCFVQHAAILHSPQFTTNRLHTSPI